MQSARFENALFRIQMEDNDRDLILSDHGAPKKSLFSRIFRDRRELTSEEIELRENGRTLG